MSKVAELTAETFEETVSNNGTVVIDFWADWCGPCKTFAPVYDEAAERHGEIFFAKVDTDAQQKLSSALDVRAMPTLMIFRDGIQIFSQAGAMPGHALDDLLGQAQQLDMDEVRAKIAEDTPEDGHDHAHEHGPGCNH